MALLNRFSKLNDKAETGVFTFIVTKSVTRDSHRDATTKDFCFGYHRWAVSFQRSSERLLGAHLLLRNASPNTACVVDFTLTLLNRRHFSHNEVFAKKQAKFTVTNPMQVSRQTRGPNVKTKLKQTQNKLFAARSFFPPSGSKACFDSVSGSSSGSDRRKAKLADESICFAAACSKTNTRTHTHTLDSVPLPLPLPL